MSEAISRVIEKFKRAREDAVLMEVLERFVREGASEADIAKLKRSIPTREQVDAMKKQIK